MPFRCTRSLSWTHRTGHHASSLSEWLMDRPTVSFLKERGRTKPRVLGGFVGFLQACPGPVNAAAGEGSGSRLDRRSAHVRVPNKSHDVAVRDDASREVEE